MCASQKYILYLIAISVLLSGSALAGDAQTSLGAEIAVIRSVSYGPFAKGVETETGEKASCISVVIYGLRKMGFDCPYKDFKKYFGNLVKQASILEIGKTKISSKGLILFNRTHFVAFYRDKNENGVVDLDDEIIHAYFSPVDVTTLTDWLQRDSNRPIYYIDLDQGVTCPN
jgi:hypothetical protein